MNQQTAGDRPAPTQKAFVLRYRSLRSSLFFAILWLLTALGALALMTHFQVVVGSAEGLTLIMTSILCVILAMSSLEQYGSPFIYLYPDRLKIHYSLLRNVNVKFSEISRMKVVEEDLELIPLTGPPVILNLGHLSFRNQEVLIGKLNHILRADQQS